MIELATAAVVAKLASDAVGAFDKIFRGYKDFVQKTEPRASTIPPPDIAYVDSPDHEAFVAKSQHTGEIYQKITYEELRNKLDGQDRQYIETLSRAMENYERQWNAALEQKSMASGMDIGKFDAQLSYLARHIGELLIKVLDFVQKMGLWLDDHYLMARSVSAEYLKDSGVDMGRQ